MRTYGSKAPIQAGRQGRRKSRRPQPKNESTLVILGSTRKSGSAACARCESKRRMSLESCALQMRMLCHGLLQMGSRHAPACPQQSVGRHGRRSAPNQHFATAVPMGSRDAGRGSPPRTCRRAAPIQVDHPGPGRRGGLTFELCSSKAPEAAVCSSSIVRKRANFPDGFTLGVLPV